MEKLIITAAISGGVVTTRVYNLGQIMPAPRAKDVYNEVKKHYPGAKISFKPDPNAAIGLKTIPRIIKGDAAEKEWGWHVGYSLEETVKDFIEEFKKSPV